MKAGISALMLGAAIALTGASAQAQQKFEMKIGHFSPAFHPMSVWLQNWADRLEKDSGGRIAPKMFAGAQLGPPPIYYDAARTGQLEVAWFLSGGTPGRFPLTELINLPYLVGSAEIGTKVLNDSQLRSKYLDAEHKGVKLMVLFTHQPGQVHTTRKPIRTVEDMKGQRIRFSSPTIRDFVAAFGATPVGVAPTDITEQLQKGTLDGTFIDYGGAGIAFKMGGTVKYVAEMYSYVASFGIAINPAFYDKLPADLKKLIDDSFVGVEKAIGEGWDSIDGPGKKALVEGGAETFRLAPAEDARFRRIGEQVAEAKIKELEGKGLPARAVYTMMRELSERHAKTSKNFWNYSLRNRPGAVMGDWRERIAMGCGYISAAAVAGMMLITVADVALRALFNYPVRGTLEIVELMLAASFFLALPATFLRDEHIVVDMIDRLVGPTGTGWLKRASAALAVVLLAVLAWQGWIAAKDTLEFNDVTSDLAIPKIYYWIPLLAGFAGSILAALAMVTNPNRAKRGGKDNQGGAV